MGDEIRSQGRALRATEGLPAQGYFYEDPIRFFTIVVAVLLMTVPAVPIWLVMAAVAVSQFNGLAMIVRVFRRGRIVHPPGGARGRTWVVQHLGAESSTLSSCTLLGGLLLLRLFGPPEPVVALGTLTIALALLPDIRVCKWVMPDDPFRANLRLERGTFLRDPVKLGAILSAFVLCMLDPDSVVFVLLSMALLQFNALVMMVDKYAAFVDWTGAERRGAARWIAPLTRDAWRVLLSILPLAILPLRAFAGDDAGWAGAGALLGFIVLPDLLRLLGLLFRLAFAETSAEVHRARRRLGVDFARAKVTVLGAFLAVPALLGLGWKAVRTALTFLILGRKPGTAPAPVPVRAWSSAVR